MQWICISSIPVFILQWTGTSCIFRWRHNEHQGYIVKGCLSRTLASDVLCLPMNVEHWSTHASLGSFLESPYSEIEIKWYQFPVLWTNKEKSSVSFMSAKLDYGSSDASLSSETQYWCQINWLTRGRNPYNQAMSNKYHCCVLRRCAKVCVELTSFHLVWFELPNKSFQQCCKTLTVKSNNNYAVTCRC